MVEINQKIEKSCGWTRSLGPEVGGNTIPQLPESPFEKIFIVFDPVQETFIFSGPLGVSIPTQTCQPETGTRLPEYGKDTDYCPD